MLADVDVLSAAPGRGAPNPSRTPRTPLQGRGSSPSPRLWQPPFCREGDNGDMGVPPGGFLLSQGICGWKKRARDRSRPPRGTPGACGGAVGRGLGTHVDARLPWGPIRTGGSGLPLGTLEEKTATV